MIKVTFHFNAPNAGDLRWVDFVFNSLEDFSHQMASDSFPVRSFYRWDENNKLEDIIGINLTNFTYTIWEKVDA
jgi:hypothetical protein